MAKKLKPVHPGEILKEDFLTPHDLSMNRLAMDLRVPVTRIADIVAERRGITADTAIRLGLYFKTSPEFWVNLQTSTTSTSPRTRGSLGSSTTSGRSKRRADRRPKKKERR